MLLDSIEARSFRNLSGKISWGPRLNIIYGDNGQGKTNWLEAIYVLARTKSFRTQRLQESITFGEDLATIAGQVTTGINVRRDLQVTLQGNTKSISVNSRREPLTRYLGQLQVVSFTGAELDTVRGVPEARRRFVDRGVSSLHSSYNQTIADYARVIKQKNGVLQEASERGLALAETEDLLAPWNAQLIGLAARIHRARTEYVSSLNEVLEPGLFEQQEITVRYVSSLSGKGDLSDYESLIAERLRLRLQAELAVGHSLIGPHRDDLEILLGGREIRVYGSSGQQRSALLLLNLAVISLYNFSHNDYPVFLIDDVDSELDERRIGHLLEYLEGRIQTFITTSKRRHFGSLLSGANLYEIENGTVVQSRQELASAKSGLGFG